MRDVSKKTPKDAGDGPPSTIKNKMEKRGHKQTKKGPKVAERDAVDQMKNNRQLDNADPFRQMMAEASRNSRYALPLNTQGTVDANDPYNVSPDEHQNSPMTRRKS